MDKCIGTVPIHLKMTLTTKEAAEYSNSGINKIDSMLRSPNCPFVLFGGTKKPVSYTHLDVYKRQPEQEQPDSCFFELVPVLRVAPRLCKLGRCNCG